LRIDAEQRAFNAVLKVSGTSAGRVRQLPAAKLEDVISSLSDRKYHLIHFSGHGASDGIFLDCSHEDGASALIDVEALKRVLRLGAPSLTIAVFMSCFSSDLAENLIAEVPWILGVMGEADDETCVAFVEQFYTALLAGHSIEGAYRHIRSFGYRDLPLVLLRRAEQNPSGALLVHAAGSMGPSIYIDISKVDEDLRRLGLTKEKFTRVLAHKIRYHSWAFRFSRQGALFPVGPVFVTLSWENAEDVVVCDRVYALKPNADRELCARWADMLTMYHDRAIAPYRDPALRMDDFSREMLAHGLHGMTRFYGDFIMDPEMGKLFGGVATRAYLTTHSLGYASMNAAGRKLKDNDLPGVVQHLEVALTAAHDLIDDIAEAILE
jgi:hypothetical protein